MWWIFGKSTEEDDTPFKHSVASFDPIATAVIIWTRVTLPSTGEAGESSEGINVMWEFSKSRDFTNVVQSGTYVTSAKRDYTVAVDVTGLEPATRYYYRFKTGNPMHLSKTGQTKTLPIGNVEEMILAHVSCANYGFGYFNVYDCLSRADNLDLVIHGVSLFLQRMRSSGPPSPETHLVSMRWSIVFHTPLFHDALKN